MGNQYEQGIDAARGVFDGMPHWREFQSRILAPYFLFLISKMSGLGWPGSQLVLAATCLLLGKVVVVRHCERNNEPCAQVFLMLLSGSALFALFVNRPWLYAWDFTGFLIFTIFVVMALRNLPWPFFVPLVLLAFLNRQSGIFICFWLVLHGLLGRGQKEKIGWKDVHWPSVVSGIVLALIGLTTIYLLTNTLLIREVGPELFQINPERTGWYHWNFSINIFKALNSVEPRNPYMPWLFYVVPLVAIVGAIYGGIRSFPRHTALCASFVTAIVFVSLFGNLGETRTMIEFIPFFSILLPTIFCSES